MTYDVGYPYHVYLLLWNTFENIERTIGDNNEWHEIKPFIGTIHCSTGVSYIHQTSAGIYFIGHSMIYSKMKWVTTWYHSTELFLYIKTVVFDCVDVAVVQQSLCEVNYFKKSLKMPTVTHFWYLVKKYNIIDNIFSE